VACMPRQYRRARLLKMLRAPKLLEISTFKPALTACADERVLRGYGEMPGRKQGRRNTSMSRSFLSLDQLEQNYMAHGIHPRRLPQPVRWSVVTFLGWWEDLESRSGGRSCHKCMCKLEGINHLKTHHETHTAVSS